MFETAELGQVIDEGTFDEHAPRVRDALLAAQQALREAEFPVIIVLAGAEKAGVGDTIRLFNTWMDPRGIRTPGFAMHDTREQPALWRFWKVLPKRGQIGVFDGAWYQQPLFDHVDGLSEEAEFDQQLARINTFERMLTDDGALVIKFWLHLGERQQRKVLEALKADPSMDWRVEAGDWIECDRHDTVTGAAEKMIARTNAGDAPWHIVEGTDARYRRLRVAMLLRHAMERHLELAARPKVESEVAPAAPVSPRSILATVDLQQSLEKREYKQALSMAQGRLARLQREASARGIATVCVFEGWDAAGKGGAIRRMVHALDARQYTVFPIAAPTQEENAHHYLWRFWRRLPPPGCMSVFDRSWYGRVLVERVEGFATPEAWRRAYGEINAFEDALIHHGVVLLKFWLHLSFDEQEKRFRARAETPHKRWKLTDDDWRNRKRWPAYESAVHDMVERTSTRAAPWHLIAAEDKRHARVEVINLIADALALALKPDEAQGIEMADDDAQ
ncbi:MAG: polyphosphate:AMP phosphotransferase [Bradymonadia bacterium]|jgi:polyphosphate:AMP phosphotransferase